MREDDEAGEDQVLADGVRHERHALLLQQRLVLLAVGRRVDRLARLRVLVDARRQHQAQVQADHGDDQAGHDEDVQGEEARQRLAGDDRSAEQQRA